MKLDTKSLDKDILAPVFKAFNLAGFQLFYVGGCVRNVILKCGPTDIDLATDATPSQMRKVAEAMHVRVIPTGEDYGTLTFRLNRRSYMFALSVQGQISGELFPFERQPRV